MLKQRSIIVAVVGVVLASVSGLQAASIDTVAVGNLGNAVVVGDHDNCKPMFVQLFQNIKNHELIT